MMNWTKHKGIIRYTDDTCNDASCYCNSPIGQGSEPLPSGKNVNVVQTEDKTLFTTPSVARPKGHPMTHEEFNEYTAELINKITSIINGKGKEYANGADRFGNFNRLAARLALPRLQVALIYLTKHLDAIESFIKNNRTYSTETIEGRLLDAIVYLMLIAGMIVEDAKKDGKVVDLTNMECSLCKKRDGYLLNTDCHSPSGQHDLVPRS